jgi:hypothetical protein
MDDIIMNASMIMVDDDCKCDYSEYWMLLYTYGFSVF